MPIVVEHMPEHTQMLRTLFLGCAAHYDRTRHALTIDSQLAPVPLHMHYRYALPSNTSKNNRIFTLTIAHNNVFEETITLDYNPQKNIYTITPAIEWDPANMLLMRIAETHTLLGYPRNFCYEHTLFRELKPFSQPLYKRLRAGVQIIAHYPHHLEDILQGDWRFILRIDAGGETLEVYEEPKAESPRYQVYTTLDMRLPESRTLLRCIRFIAETDHIVQLTQNQLWQPNAIAYPATARVDEEDNHEKHNDS